MGGTGRGKKICLFCGGYRRNGGRTDVGQGKFGVEVGSMRTLVHLDMNSYFASAEQQANPYLRGKPVGVIKAEGRGCIIAASIEAKKYGIRTGTTIWEARKLCPQILLVPSNMEKYFSLTRKLIEIAESYSPIVEVFSIDEVFLDVTGVMSNYCGGVWEMALRLKLEIKEKLGDWMRCSVGISFNKVAAKLASEMHKPDGLTFLTQEDYLGKTEKIAVEEVCGIGRARTQWLKERGVFSLGQARKLDLPADLESLVWLRGTDKLVTRWALPPAKSVSRTYTTFRDVWREWEVKKLVRNLVEETAGKLREMEMAGRTLSLILSSTAGGNFWTRRTIMNSTNDPLTIFTLLWKEYENKPLLPVRFAGVGVSNLMNNLQCKIYDRRDNLLRTADVINEKHGYFMIYPARLLGGEIIRKEVTGFLGDKRYQFVRREGVEPTHPFGY
jgi:DNA polymerase-4